MFNYVFLCEIITLERSKKPLKREYLTLSNLKNLLSIGLATGLLFSGTQAFAEKSAGNDKMDIDEIQSLTEYQMPQDVKEVVIREAQSKAERRANLEKDNGDIVTQATSAFPGNTTSDTSYSKTFGSKGQNTIYTKVDKTGFWTGVAYNQFSGWGYTGYFGTANPSTISSKVTVKAYGLLPNISINGSNWSLLSTAKQIASDSNGSGYNYARANYSNVKIQDITGINAIFVNAAYIKLPSGLNDSWSEDTYVWF